MNQTEDPSPKRLTIGYVAGDIIVPNSIEFTRLELAGNEITDLPAILRLPITAPIITADLLAILADNFRAALFKMARKQDPRSGGVVPADFHTNPGISAATFTVLRKALVWAVAKENVNQTLGETFELLKGGSLPATPVPWKIIEDLAVCLHQFPSCKTTLLSELINPPRKVSWNLSEAVYRYLRRNVAANINISLVKVRDNYDNGVYRNNYDEVMSWYPAKTGIATAEPSDYYRTITAGHLDELKGLAALDAKLLSEAIDFITAKDLIELGKYA